MIKRIGAPRIFIFLVFLFKYYGLPYFGMLLIFYGIYYHLCSLYVNRTFLGRVIYIVYKSVWCVWAMCFFVLYGGQFVNCPYKVC